MHQPWASLLVWGIKRIEGRGWSSPHRGRLWIASTAKQPTQEEIEVSERWLATGCAALLQQMLGTQSACHRKLDSSPTLPLPPLMLSLAQEMEAFYREVHAPDALEFPPAYPTGVLLGCVEVVDVVPAEVVEAWEGLPGGIQAEVGSPHCFLCQQAQRLVVPQQMRGSMKIYELEKKVGRWVGGRVSWNCDGCTHYCPTPTNPAQQNAPCSDPPPPPPHTHTPLLTHPSPPLVASAGAPSRAAGPAPRSQQPGAAVGRVWAAAVAARRLAAFEK